MKATKLPLKTKLEKENEKLLKAANQSIGKSIEHAKKGRWGMVNMLLANALKKFNKALENTKK